MAKPGRERESSTDGCESRSDSGSRVSLSEPFRSLQQRFYALSLAENQPHMRCSPALLRRPAIAIPAKG